MLRPYKGKRQKARMPAVRPKERLASPNGDGCNGRLALQNREHSQEWLCHCNEDYSFLDQGGTTPDMRA